MKAIWKETIEEVNFNPFAQGQSTFICLATEKDIETGGNDKLFGDSVESAVSAVEQILDRINNPLWETDSDYIKQEKDFYERLLVKLQGLM